MVRALAFCAVPAIAGCNALWGSGDLSFDAAPGSTMQSGATGGAGGSGGASGGGGDVGGASVGGGGSGGSGGDPDGVVELGERPDTDYAGVTFDTAVYDDLPDHNYGGAAEIWVDGTPRRPMLLRFDLTVLPRSSVITAAELVLHSADCTTCDTLDKVSVYRLLEAWDEGMASGGAGVANYTHRQSGVLWTAAGAGVGSREDIVIASAGPIGLDSEFTITLDVTVVAAWLTSPQSNFGVELETGEDGVKIHLSESPDAQKRPLLRLTLRARLTLDRGSDPPPPRRTGPGRDARSPDFPPTKPHGTSDACPTGMPHIGRTMVGSAGVFTMLGSIYACERIERETIDRVADHEASVWTSQGDCESLFPERPARTNPRIGTWNVEYFPDGEETETSDEDGTNVQWLACAIASLDVDVLAVQEFKTTDKARQKAEELVARLNELTAGDWQLALAPCLPNEVQHPGFLYDQSRVTGTHFREIPILNPDPVCSNEVSPGFGGYFEIEGGPDFHLVSVHMEAGSNADAIAGRRYALAQIQDVIDAAYAIVPDSDIIFTGDFNTIGCGDCNPPVSSDEEVASLAATMSSMDEPLSVVGASETCSFQDDETPHLLLDHFVVAQSADEMPSGAVAHVSGICEEIGCDRLRNWLEDARDHLSDHCPVLLESGRPGRRLTVGAAEVANVLRA